MTVPSGRPPRRGWQIAVAVILAIIGLSLIIPGVRASVSSWLGLSVAPNDQMPVSAVTLVPVTVQPPVDITPTDVPPVSTSQTQAAMLQAQTTPNALTDFDQFRAQAGWEVLSPTFLPEGYHFQSAFYDTNHKMLILTYLVTRPLPGATDPSLTSSETITLLQSLKNDEIPMQIAPNTNVEDIQINGQPAAFTVGGWDTEFVKDSSSPNGGKMVSSWRNDLPVKNLYWEVASIYLALITTDESVSQQELIDMASSVGK